MNAINWFEIPAANFERAVAFYETILAAKLKIDTSFPDIQMAVFSYECPGVGGGIIAMEGLRPNPDGVRIYLNGGDDLATILSRVAAAGGQVLLPKTLLSEHIGYIATFRDSEGNVIGLHSQH
ncbi:VOC family protein [Uliginosibacterium gangwonense]|uniref:VOC family protein n=1 Tax=Uliginosibacterium gangwonense TaxID=392736 RepID=UPI00038224A1|nr:VOC family protein [Uliginosibacterium gangwonense]